MMKSLIQLAVILGLALPMPAAAQNAADEYFDPAEMAKARAHIRHHNGGQSFSYFEGERLELRLADGESELLWDAQGWIGTDERKLWVKSEGEYSFTDNQFEEAEIQALYSKPIGNFFDIQAGVRADLSPDPERVYAVVGVQGLAPYMFEVDAAAFVSNKGDVSARVEAEYDVRIAQRLVLQPRAELNLALQDVPELAIGAGLTQAEVGLRLRYEIKREFAPYIGVSWTGAGARTARFLRARGERPSSAQFVAGIRFWF